MKLTITTLDSGIKKKTSKVMDVGILAMEKSFATFLSINPHMKGVKDVSITMSLCGKTKIRTLNRQYRHKDYATDVLSFPIYENLRPDKKPFFKNLAQIELGDVIICKDVAKSQAREFGIRLEEEIIHLAVHGFLHLLGFDHEISPKEEKIMEKHEAELINIIYKKMSSHK